MRYLKICLDEVLNIKSKEILPVKVVAENKKQIVVDKPNWGFVIVDTEKAKKGFTQFNPLLEAIQVSDYSQDSYFRKAWGHIVVTVFTESLSDKVLSNKINREVNKFIKKQQNKYGFYFNGTSCKVKI